MKRILAVALMGLLIATAAVKAAPPLFSSSAESASGHVELVQFKKGKGWFKKGKGRFKGKGFKKGQLKGTVKGKGPHCFNRCVATGKSGMQCQGRCR